MKIGEEKNIKLTDDPKILIEIDEQIKQASIENKQIKKRLNDIKQIIGQTIISDKNIIEWARVGDGVYDYGEGKIGNASFVLTMSWETLVGLLREEINIVSAFATKIQVEGSYMDMIKVSNFIEFAKDIIKGKKVKSKKKIQSKRKRKLKREELKKEINRRDDLEMSISAEKFKNFKPYECEYCGRLIKHFSMTQCPNCNVELKKRN